MNPRRALFVVLALAGLTGGCSHEPPRQAVLDPPRVDLSRFGTLGLVEFQSGSFDGFGASVSRDYLAALQAAQPGTPVLELGDERHVLGEVGGHGFDPDTVRAIGAKYHVDALVVGALDAQRVAPNVSFDSAVRWMTASAVLEGSLHVRILDAKSGATLWSNLSRSREEVARMNVNGGGISGVGATPPDEARQRMVERMVQRSTDDFWAHWR